MNNYLSTLLAANNVAYEDLSKQLGFNYGQLKSRYKPAEELKYKYKMVVKLDKLGYKIPYHHRPICKECGARYIPKEMRQYTCSECAGLEGFTLSPTDLIELGHPAPAAAAELGLPATKAVLGLLEAWEEDKEGYFIDRLRKALKE